MGDKADGKRWGWSTWLWIVMLLLAFYVLSVGPAFRWMIYTGHFPALTAYKPVFWIMDHTPPPINKVWDWYLGFWRDVGG